MRHRNILSGHSGQARIAARDTCVLSWAERLSPDDRLGAVTPDIHGYHFAAHRFRLRILDEPAPTELAIQEGTDISQISRIIACAR
jgi:hypothetical protein